MAIKFSCPNCGKNLSVKDQLAGKRGACSGCKKVITIPDPGALARAAAQEAEALAAAAFADAQVAAPEPETKTIDFTCPMCDEKVTVSMELAGKQTPCPSCRRIIKVPLPVKKEPVDWRTVKAGGPSGARRDTEPAPDGAWGSTTSAGTVSRESLLEAEAIPDLEEDEGARRRWIVRGVVAALLLVAGGAGVWGAITLMARNRQEKLMDQAVAAVTAADASSKYAPETLGAVHEAAGEYQLRMGKGDSATKASTEFEHARKAYGAVAQPERDLLLAGLALRQVELGGDKGEVDQGHKLDWKEAQKAVRQTLEQLKGTDGRTDGPRVEAARLVARRLAARGQAARAQVLLSQLRYSDQAGEASEEQIERVAAAGVELFQAGAKKEAEAIVQHALELNKPRGKGDAAKAPPLAPSLVTLCELLGKPVPQPRPGADEEADRDSILIGRAEAQARQGNKDRAWQMTGEARNAQVRLRALVAIAGSQTGNPPDAAFTQTALDLYNGELKGQGVPDWLVLRLCQLGARDLLFDRAEQAAASITNVGLRGQAQLAILRGRLAASSEKAGDELPKTLPEKSAARAPAWLTFARHNAREGGALKAVDTWDEPLRPLGWAGIALGLQD